MGNVKQRAISFLSHSFKILETYIVSIHKRFHRRKFVNSYEVNECIFILIFQRSSVSK